MKISIDKLKLCYTLYEHSPLFELMETPLDVYELPHWDFVSKEQRANITITSTKSFTLREQATTPTASTICNALAHCVGD